jgi:hypothetical protein
MLFEDIEICIGTYFLKCTNFEKAAFRDQSWNSSIWNVFQKRASYAVATNALKAADFFLQHRFAFAYCRL